MAKESLPSLSELVYPALAGCKAPVDVILPQITSNIWSVLLALGGDIAMETELLLSLPNHSFSQESLKGLGLVG